MAHIDEDTFDGLDDLAGLDLSISSHVKIPSTLFHLPSLQTLYLSQMINCNVVETIESTRPITCPLVQLDISYSEIERLPDMELLPTLVKYNISGMYKMYTETHLDKLFDRSHKLKQDSILRFINFNNLRKHHNFHGK